MMILNSHPPMTARQTVKSTGSLLIIVMWISLGLVTVALLFGHSSTLAFRGADNQLAGYQANQAIEGAARYVQYLLANTDTPGEMPATDSYHAEQLPVGDAAFWFLAHNPDPDDTQSPIYALVDECSKLNLNTATAAMLEGLPGMTAELAAAIIDWRDTDDEPQENGA
jgi:DNA uptake protein ComE-like DNA-binding protein